FDCDLQAGEYALTFRLENSLSESVCELMDKQVNAAIFRVFNSPKYFDAVVNLHGAFEPVPFCCETRATQ
ncbi:ABC transporter ATP-binding protein, partial [Pseudomonas aeruginosa]|nr:ABC transporter ATP-binding protein [Pseudomonas aeruginosa]